MTPAEAAWVRDHVWPAAMRRETGTAGLCPCQWGLCGHCAAGQHTECRTPDWAIPYGYLTDRHTHVLADVWLADRACRWVCPCPCRTDDEEKA